MKNFLEMMKCVYEKSDPCVHRLNGLHKPYILRKTVICGCMGEKNGTVITIPRQKLAKPSGKSVYWDLKRFTFILITTIICWKMQE